MTGMKGIAVLPSLKVFAALAEQDSIIYVIPSPLRLVRTTFGDNGFSGVRTLTSRKAFFSDMARDENFAEKLSQVESVEAAEKEAQTAFDGLREDDYIIISPEGTSKYIVCNPKCVFVLTVVDGIVHLCVATKESIKKELGKKDKCIIEASFASFV